MQLKISLPWQRPTAGRPPQKQHLQVQLSDDQAVALDGIHEALIFDDIRLENGRRIQSKADTVRWLLGSIAVSADIATQSDGPRAA